MAREKDTKQIPHEHTLQGEHALEHAAHGGVGRTHTEHEHHIVPLSVYYKVFAALMVGLLLTVGVALIDFSRYGPNWAWLNIVIALIIAFSKTLIVVLYFMHVKYSSGLTKVFAGAAFIWLMILFFEALADYFTRDWIPQPGAWTVPGM